MEVSEKAIVNLFLMQMAKIEPYRKDAIWLREQENMPPLNKMVAIVDAMEADDKDALYQVQKWLYRSPLVSAMLPMAFYKQSARLLGCEVGDLLVDGPALFVNQPGAQRLLYKWHTEALYYPKRRRFLNVWFPIFVNKRDQSNGTMAFKPKSHKRVWDASLMSEYTGYNKDTENKKNHFVQYELPANFLTEYDTHHCVSEKGDVIFFDRNLVHTSMPNVSKDMAFAIVCRVWTPEDDLTLSGNMECQPYGGNQGRANLIVRPPE